jgi:hypothetical protein
LDEWKREVVALVSVDRAEKGAPKLVIHVEVQLNKARITSFAKR